MTNFVEALLAKSASGRKEQVRAKLRVAVTELLQAHMADQEVSRSELAQRTGVSRSAITQALSSRNLSLNTLADIADALNLDVSVLCRPKARSRRAAVAQSPQTWSVFAPVFTNDAAGYTESFVVVGTESSSGVRRSYLNDEVNFA